MAWTITRRRALQQGCAAAAALVSGCGTILHPERRGQPAGRLDWGVVLLDGLGLLFFFVPGVIAFAVDFATGAIYLPPDQCLGQPPEPPDQHGLVSFRVPRETLTLETVGDVVSRNSGRTVDLANGEYRTEEMRSLQDFPRLRAQAGA